MSRFLLVQLGRLGHMQGRETIPLRAATALGIVAGTITLLLHRYPLSSCSRDAVMTLVVRRRLAKCSLLCCG
jgi:hypothetical protein